MNKGELIQKNIRYFSRYYKLIAVAVSIGVAVITGSLLIGDSVRHTLVKRVNERLGSTETVIFSLNSFMQEEILQDPLLQDARGVLLTRGFISHSGKMLPVMVWGTDEYPLSPGKARINEALARELKTADSDLVLRLPATGLVPSGSLFVTENYTTSLWLACEGVVKAEEGGNISLKNEQTIPLNLFVNRRELAQTLETEGRINLILSGREITREQFEAVWNYPVSGLQVQSGESFTEITSDRVFIQNEVIRLLCRNNRETNRLFSYLVNSIEKEEATIPYSFVTAVDTYKDLVLAPGEMILSDYAAHRIQASVNDSLQLTYFTAADLKTLSTDTVRLRVKAIVPLAELKADPTLSAEFPGLSDVERCTDWDSDLPVNMELITDEDEKYWEEYRNTPKALVSYEAVVPGWSNSFGSATSIRIHGTEPDLSGLESEMFGIQLIHPRQAGLMAAMNGVDFSGLFLALGFFIILSAGMLMSIPLAEMLYRRRGEIGLLQSFGYRNRKIVRNLWLESAPVVFFAALAGVVIGILYTTLVVWLLGTVWKGATRTDGFILLPNLYTVGIGLLTGIILAMAILRINIGRSIRKIGAPLRLKVGAVRRKPGVVIAATLLTILLIVINLFTIASVTLFVVGGGLLLVTTALWGDYLLVSRGGIRQQAFTSSKLVWATLYAHRKQVYLSYFTLAIGVFIVFSVGLNRQGFTDSTRLAGGTGGYTLWGESTVPLYHNLATETGRERLALTGLPAETDILQCLRYSADEASCLNLNKVVTPSVLGVDMQALAESSLGVNQDLYRADRHTLFEKLTQTEEGIYPALVDETVLLWSLGMKLGDTIRYEGNNGKKVTVRLVGTLDNTIFQGHLLIDKKLFSGI